MRRLRLAPRADWRARAEALGFAFHTIDGEPYWDESAAYEFTAAEIDALEAATGELEQLCLEAVDRVVRDRLYEPLRLPREAALLVEESWSRRDRNLYGRFDLSYHEGQPPKLLEYNADTPTALYEASVVQWEWLQTVFPDADQFNSIHEQLVEAWPQVGMPRERVHFTCVRDHAEDYGTVEYLRDAAMQAGLDTAFLYIDEIGWNGTTFVDRDGQPVARLFKLYPWEWLIAEPFAAHIPGSGTRFIEPAWKMVLSSKAVLALLWHMFPDHPNLLPAFLEREEIDGPVVRKPIFGREGANVTIEAGPAPVSTGGDYGAEGFVYQAFAPLPVFDGRHAVIGSWVVASQPAGIGIRDDAGPVTLNTSRFVPHLFR